jgi:hypothetical protein
MRKFTGLTLAWLAMTVGPSLAQAQTTATTTKPAAAPPPAPALSPTEQWIKDAKSPAPWFSWGADLRLRNEYLNNAHTLGNADVIQSGVLVPHEQDYFRFRGRVWTTVMPVQDLSFNARLSAEPREWMRPSMATAYRGQSGMEWRYGIFDKLNIRWTNILGQPLSLTAGRQDVNATGRQDIQAFDPLSPWLVADGTPNDGSWAFFLDGIRMTLDLQDVKTRIDTMYVYQNANPGAWLPTVGCSHGYNLTEQNEQGVIFYVSNKSIKNTQVDAFFIYKRDNAAYAYGDDANLYTLGAKVSGDVLEHWKYSVEGAYQFGNKDLTYPVRGAPVNHTTDRDVSAWALNSRLTYLAKDELKNQFRMNCEFLSGDDPNTSKNESFDLLWGRWPRWSEMYIYSYIPETGRNAQVGNLIRFGPGWSISPTKQLDFSVDYFAMFADQKFDPNGDLATHLPVSGPSPGASGGGFGTGTFRGHYLQAILRYKMSQHLSAHLWGEFVWMGDYYVKRDLMSFLRAELLLTF